MSVAIPQGWQECLLEDCVEVLDSIRVPVNNEERQTRIEGKAAEQLYPYYGATGQVGVIDDFLFDEELVALGEDGVPFLDPLKSKAYMLRGKTWVNNHAHVLRGFEGVALNKFIFYYLNQFDYQGYVNGGTRLKLTQANMRAIPVPLPPLAEQTRIADKLDELLAQVDTLKARIDGIPARLKRFRQSVLAAAVSGRKNLDWPTVSLGDCCDVLGGKRLPKGYELSDTPTGFPYIRVTDFSSYTVSIEKLKYVPSDAADTIKKYIIESGDVYISIAGSIGVVGQVPEALSGSNLTENAARIVIRDGFDSRFLMYQLASQKLQEQMQEKQIATTQPKLGLFRIKQLELYKPSVDAQVEVVRHIEQLFAFADQLEAKVNEAKTRIERLTQSILAKAFRGELVPQDPSDEPASELLARIQAQRASAPKARRGRKKTEDA